MFKNPSLLDSLLGKKGKTGVLPSQAQLSKIGLGRKKNRGKKATFKYYGEDIREGNMQLIEGSTYGATFIKEDELRITGKNTKEKLIIELNHQPKENQYNVTVQYILKGKSGEEEPQEVGSGKIIIIDINS